MTDHHPPQPRPERAETPPGPPPTGVGTLDPPPPPPSAPPASSGVPRWAMILGGVAVVALLVAGVAGLWLMRQINPPGEPGEEVTLEIPEGTSLSRIGELLADAEVITRSDVFRFYIRFNDAPDVQAGKYQLATNMAMGDVLDVLGAGPIITFDRVTVPEGLTVAEIIGRVDANERLSGQRFSDLIEGGELRSNYQPDGSSNLEGLLFPDTYFVDEREDERDLLQRMIATMDSTAAQLGYDDAPARVGLSPYETLIVASLIEREARVPEDRAKISRVIHNRIAKGMLLQVDATVIYAHGGGITRVLFRHLEIDSPYNTYKVPGLPPTPIAAPGRAALEAAINPADGDWLYYVVTESDGRHSFAETLEGHNENIRQAERNGVR